MNTIIIIGYVFISMILLMTDSDIRISISKVALASL